MLLFIVTAGQSQSPFLDSLSRFVAKHTGDTLEVLALDALGSEFMRSDMDRAKSYVYPQIKLAEAIEYHNGLARAYAGIIPIHLQTGRIDSAQYYVNQMEALYKRTASRRVGINYTNTTGLFYKNQGRLKEALPFLVEALRLIGPNGDKTNRGGQNLNIGNAYYTLGDLTNASSYHLKGLALFEEVGNKRGQSYCLQGLGADFLALKQYDIAEKYFRTSLKIKEELNDKRGVLTTLMNLGIVYQKLKKPERSLEFLEKALKMAREAKLTIDERDILYNKGSLYKSIGKTEESRREFTESMRLGKQIGDSLFVTKVRVELVMIDNDKQKIVREEQTLIENIRISLELGDRRNMADGYFKMAEWYSTHGEYEKAFNNLKQGRELEDSVTGKEVTVQLKRQEYNSEKKEKEIALLKKDQEVHALTLSRQKAFTASIVIALIGVVVIGLLLVNRYRVINQAKRLVEIERVRNSIARDLHDDIGSTLSSINILSKVGLVEKNGNAENYLQRIGDQSERMMEDISDIVWSINPQNDSMSKVVVRMREFSGEIFESKNIAWNFSEDISNALVLDSEKRKNLFLIFKESVNNAAKYSNASQIDISLKQEHHTLVMRVKDNGQGFDEESIKAGNGLRNLRERATEVKGLVTLKSSVGNGTEIELRLPIA
jgi:two-component system sensor histidine kinase UhpB